MTKLRNIISSEPLNTGRQFELDLGKAIPILCMPFVHCIIECSTEEQLLHGIPYAFDMIIGGPMSAPMFMFCMGATVHFSKNNSPRQLAKRGLQLLLFGMILNICCYLIPYLIGYAVTGDAEQFLTPLPFYMFGIDILQFAGATMLLLALMTGLKMPKPLMFGIALGLSVAGSFIRGIDLGNDVLNVILGWFVGTDNEAELIVSDFPIFNWLLIPVCGYLFGWLLQRVKDKRKFYLSFSPLLLTASIAYFIIGDHFEIGMFAEGENAYYHMLTYDVFASIAFSLGLLGVYCAAERVLPSGVKNFFSYTSMNITAFYCIHWVFIRIIINVVLYSINGTQELYLPYTLLISLTIELLTFAVIHIYRKIQNKTGSHKGRVTS